MNGSQAVLITVLVVFMMIVVPTAILALSFVVAYKRGRYNYCLSVVRRLPFIVDANGIISPEMVCAAAIRAHDFELASQWLAKASRQGILPVHRLLELMLLAEQDHWDRAAQVFVLLTNEANNFAQDYDVAARQQIQNLAEYIQARNAPKIDQMSRGLI